VDFYFFFRSDCLIAMYSTILSMLEKTYVSKSIGLPGWLAHANGLLATSSSIRARLPAFLRVEQTPALFLMKPPRQIVPLSQGALSLENSPVASCWLPRNRLDRCLTVPNHPGYPLYTDAITGFRQH